MKIITYHSANARPEICWIAYIVGEKPKKTKSNLDHGETNDPKGFLPSRFVGATEEEVSAMAVKWWQSGEEKRERKLAAWRTAAAKRAAKETK
ncbi:hypothetical protein [Maritalea porphyrae]|uniref:hypothetical protein n=1 Tax=Maritalea porphyrae TaxID=880732 RepID=UPI0022B06A19|nr:hypothetical protein [Maritalea porphyrae]MCZ4270776.1 hypothetical protein [Maritalea porphyrae]